MNLPEYLALRGPEPDAHISYGSAPSQYIELFLPASTARPAGTSPSAYTSPPADTGPSAGTGAPAAIGAWPVAILVHGGCWLKQFEGIRQMRNMAGALAAQGIAVWNVEYRRVDETGGGYPGTYQDISAALDMLQASAAARRLDLSRTVAIGHSAGGHLVQWLAGRARIGTASPLYQARPLQVTQIIALGSISDLQTRQESDHTICGVDIVRLTGLPNPARPDVYADTNPAALLPNGSHTVLINGALDSVSPPQTALDYAAHVRAAGDAIDTVLLPNASHYDEVAATSAAWPQILAAVRAALNL